MRKRIYKTSKSFILKKHFEPTLLLQNFVSFVFKILANMLTCVVSKALSSACNCCALKAVRLRLCLRFPLRLPYLASKIASKFIISVYIYGALCVILLNSKVLIRLRFDFIPKLIEDLIEESF